MTRKQQPVAGVKWLFDAGILDIRYVRPPRRATSQVMVLFDCGCRMWWLQGVQVRELWTPEGTLFACPDHRSFVEVAMHGGRWKLRGGFHRLRLEHQPTE